MQLKSATTEDSNGTNAIEDPTMPKGGGSLGYGEHFRPNPFTGSAGFTIPLPFAKSRALTPSWSLDYSSDAPNGPFGLGFTLVLPLIATRTNGGIPRYDGTETYARESGAVLTPRLDFVEGEWVAAERSVEVDGVLYQVVAYRQVVEREFDRIERWTEEATGLTHWKITDAQNGTTTYGASDQSRIYDPAHPGHIFSWLAEAHVDAHGNRILFEYKSEDDAGLTEPEARLNSRANRYPLRIRYGNYVDENGDERFNFHVIFDYGERDLEAPTAAPIRPWSVRTDPFSSFRAGFQIRTNRICSGVLFANEFPKELGEDPVIVNVVRLDYDASTTVSLLQKTQRTGFRTDGGKVRTKSMPALRLGYTAWRPETASFAPLEVYPDSALPGVVGGDGFQMVDLYGAGLPGILATQNPILEYWEPIGGGRYVPGAPPPEFPINRPGSTAALMDLGGNGSLDMLVSTPGQVGYYANNNDGTWEPYQPLAAVPTALADPHATFVDLSGDGRSDLLCGNSDQWIATMSRGNDGFGNPVANDPPIGIEGYKTTAETVIVAFADVFGDGLSHLVRVSDGRVQAWPNLGYGEFGAPRDLFGAPAFPPSLKASQILLADVSGDGFADLIFVLPDRVEVYANEAGNRFAAPVSSPIPGAFSALDRVTAADVLGIGAVAIVISQVRPDSSAQYLDLCGGIRPYRLNAIDNGMGASTRIVYRSSTEYAQAAQRAGEPWATSLAFPVLVVGEVETVDGVDQARLTQTFQYRDGYYDPVDRQFRGFAYVQSQDTPAVNPSVWYFARSRESAPQEESLEPLLKRSWNLPGADLLGEVLIDDLSRWYFDGDRNALTLPTPYFDPAIFEHGGPTMREAWRALAGSQYRAERYGVLPDGMPKAAPYDVEQSAFGVRMIQPIRGRCPAVFQILERESAASIYETEAADPRVSHRFSIEFDELGQTVRTAEVGYPRRKPANPPLPGQVTTSFLIQTSGLVNHLDGTYRNGSGGPLAPLRTKDDEPFHLVGFSFENRTYEVAGFDPPAPFFSYDEAKAVAAAALADSVSYGTPFSSGKLQSRVFEWTQELYWDEGRESALPLQEISPQALTHHRQTAAFPETFVTDVYGSRVDDAMLTETGGYQRQDDYWWSWGEVARYRGSADYFLIESTTNPFGNRSSVTYDAYALMVTSTANALNQVSTATPDYQALQYASITDVNQNVFESLYDPLAQMMVASRHGTLDGKYVGDDPISEYEIFEPATTQAILDDPVKYLQGAGAYYHEDLTSWADGGGQPPHTLIVERRVYAHPENDAPTEGDTFGIGIAFFDGLVRRVSVAELVSGEPPYPFSSAPARLMMATASEATWVVPQQTIYDARGNVANLYVPFFTETPAFVARPEVGRSTLFYDALGRQIRKLTAAGFLTRDEFRSWTYSRFDEDDTVKESPYYREHIDDPNLPLVEKKALEKAAVFEGTPRVTQLDVRGRGIQEIKYLVSEAGQSPTLLYSYRWLDARGGTIAFADPRFYNAADPGQPAFYNQIVAFDMLGRNVEERNADAGNLPITGPASGVPVLVLYNALGEEVRRWDQLGYTFARSYTPLRHPDKVAVTGNELDQVIERFLYGDTPGENTVNRIVKIYDDAGEVTVPGYSLTEDPLGQTRRYRLAYSTPPNWNDPTSVPFEPEVWTTATDYNALGDPLATAEPNSVVVYRGYFRNSWLRTAHLTPSEGGDRILVAGPLTYASSGEPRETPLGNGAVTQSEYDPLTLRVVSITTTPEAGTDPVLNLGYVYDPRGNVSFCANSTPVPGQPSSIPNGDADYIYDSLYRLLGATGRTLEAGVVGRYAQSFEYDWSDNLCQIEQTLSNPWVRRLVVSDSSNHAIPAEMAASQPVDDYFDPNGNLSELETGTTLSYNPSGRLSQSVSGDEEEFEQYDSGGYRARKVTVIGGERVENLYVADLVIQRKLAEDAVSQDPRFSLRIERDGRLLALYESQSGEVRWRYQLEDRLWSVAAELDEAANELSYEEYQPYGDPAVSVLVDDRKIYRFVQKELDSITGLYAIGQRYYIPSQGRWISPDPAGDIDGSNLFAYVRGNPITRRDENGECGHPPGQENQPPTNLQKVYTSMKLLNVWNTALNGILDARVTHLEMTHQFKYPFSGRTAEIYKAGFQGAMLGRVGIFAMFGGLTGLASSTANMAKYGPNRSNVLNSVGNIFFAAEGYTMLSALIQSSHGFHHKMILASKLGGVADMTKAVNSALDRDYYSTAMYTSLGMGNLFVTMSTKTRLSYYRQAVKATPKDFRLLTRLAMRGFVSPQYLLLLGGGMSLYKAVKLTGSQQGGSSSHGHHD